MVLGQSGVDCKLLEVWLKFVIIVIDPYRQCHKYNTATWSVVLSRTVQLTLGYIQWYIQHFVMGLSIFDFSMSLRCLFLTGFDQTAYSQQIPSTSVPAQGATLASTNTPTDTSAHNLGKTSVQISSHQALNVPQ